MKFIRRSIFSLSLSCLSCGALADTVPKYVFYFIGDGLSATQRQVSEYYLQHKLSENNYRLAMNNMPVVGINTTHALDSLVTDSAASATALASGVKTNNGIIGMTADGKKTRTLLEAAQTQGMRTGLVTTTRLTHATPAAFIAKNMSRGDENGIADDYLHSNIDFLAGGGYRNFIAGSSQHRTDNKNLIQEFHNKGYKTFTGLDTVASFRHYQPAKGDQVIALFTPSHLPYELDRKKDNSSPSLAEITDKAIAVLANDDKGFFLMVEGGRIDHASHANDITATIYDTLALDEAVASALSFYQRHPTETLIVITGDHETGGLGLGFGNNYFMNMENVYNQADSIEDKLQGVYNGNRQAFFKHIEERFQLTKLTDAEQHVLTNAMNAFDKDAAAAKKEVAGYDPVAIAIAHITSKRAGVYWTSYAHTGTQLPLSAIGVQADKFGGFKDNTEVAKTFAEIMDLSIGVIP